MLFRSFELPSWSVTFYLLNLKENNCNPVLFFFVCTSKLEDIDSLFFLYRHFNKYGIIRNIVHNHILQTIALFAMEPPVGLDGEDIRNEKVNAR